MTERTKVYLGDGAYAEFDGYGIMLTAENGITATDSIYLEPDIYATLTRFVDRLRHEDAHVLIEKESV